MCLCRHIEGLWGLVSLPLQVYYFLTTHSSTPLFGIMNFCVLANWLLYAYVMILFVRDKFPCFKIALSEISIAASDLFLP